MRTLADYLGQSPLIAILRGLRPDQAVAVGAVLLDSGFSIIEVPLNSPDPYASIKALAAEFSGRALIGAGTVVTADEIDQVRAAGAGLIVSPHCSPANIAAAKASGLVCIPGIATPSEGFAALAAGADALKLFPAELITPAVLKAMRAVLPPAAILLPVGGITPANLAAYVQAGASGFGLGSALFKPDMDVQTIEARARAFCEALRTSGL